MRIALETCQAEGMSTELVHLADFNIQPCNECLVCKTTQECPIADDLYTIYEKMRKAQGIIFSSPVFFSSATPEIKALIDRAGYLGIAQGRPFERKVGGALVVGRRAGHNFVFMELLFFFLYHGMIIPGSTYWNVGLGRDAGEAMKDEEGIRTIQNFARNLSWLIKKLEK
jgi:multimeric flavodoxin WrbA